MKKKILALLMATMMVLSLAACGGGSSDSGSDSSDDGGSDADSGSADYKIGMVTDVGGVNDGSFNQSAWEGLQKAKDDFGVEVKYLESGTDADYIPNIETFVDEDYDLIICIGYQLADALREQAEANPDVQFAIVDDSSCEDLDNVSCLMFEQSQASYLVGYLAGLTTESNTIGFVLGMSTDTMNEFGYGYCAGAIDANPDVKILQTNANSFADTAAGKTAANNMIAEGADVIFHAAGGTGLGVIDACKEAGIWAIGVDSDQSSVAPDAILSSAMKRVDNACYDEIEALVNDKIESGIKVFSLTDEGVDLAPTTDNISEENLTKVNEVKDKIISGEVEVAKNKEQFDDKYGDIYKLAE
ncbi:MAG: BMP family protein [Suipraeoptans sp.]